MKKKFEKPELNIILFSNEDIIMTSYVPNGAIPGDTFDGTEEPVIPD